MNRRRQRGGQLRQRPIASRLGVPCALTRTGVARSTVASIVAVPTLVRIRRPWSSRRRAFLRLLSACGRPSQARHSGYWRTLKHSTARGGTVTLRVHVSRWRDKSERCATVATI
jgi:hypothetical protein